MNTINKVLEELSDFTVEMDTRGNPSEMSKRDVMNACLIFQHVVSSYAYKTRKQRHGETNEKKLLDIQTNEAIDFALGLRDLIKNYTGIIPSQMIP